jgi:GAF domain-containing protein
MRNSNLRCSADLDHRLQEAIDRIGQDDDVSASLYEVLVGAIALTGADLGTIQHYDVGEDCLKIIASHGFPDDVLAFFLIVRRDTNSSCAASFKQRMRVVVHDVTKSYLFVGTRELSLLQQAGIDAVHSSPLITGSGRLWGIITMHFREQLREGDYEPAALDRLALRLASRLDDREIHFSTKR